MHNKFLSSVGNNCNVIASEYFYLQFCKTATNKMISIPRCVTTYKGKTTPFVNLSKVSKWRNQKHQYIDKATHQNLCKKGKQFSKYQNPLKWNCVHELKELLYFKLIIIKHVIVFEG